MNYQGISYSVVNTDTGEIRECDNLNEARFFLVEWIKLGYGAYLDNKQYVD